MLKIEESTPKLRLMKNIYFDYQATTPIDPRVLDAMLPYYTSSFGNAHSRTHQYGWTAEEGVNLARLQIANLIGAKSSEILFTSGATESNNLALKGLVMFKSKDILEKNNLQLQKRPPKIHIITSQIEHKCILDTCRHLEETGCEVTYLPVNSKGVIDLEMLQNSIKPNTALISIMAINNEIGSTQPLEEIGKIAKKYNVPFHCDAAQAVGKVDIDVEKMNISLLSLSGHKIYGPKGVGALYCRKKPRIRLSPLINGGGQEKGLRSGTLPVPLCVGLGKAAEICKKEMKNDLKWVSGLKKKFLDYFKGKVDYQINGSEYPGCTNLSFPFVEGEGLLMKLNDVALSSGSACTSASLEPSYVIRALNVKDDLAHSSIRFGTGRFTTSEEVDNVAKKTVEGVTELSAMSPLREMVNEGIDLSTIKWSEH